MKKVLGIILSITMLVTMIGVNVLAEGTDIIHTDTLILQSGETDENSIQNVAALQEFGLSANRIYNAGTSDSVNKLYAVDSYEGRTGTILKMYQDGYTGPNNYNTNMPFLYYGQDNIGDRAFTAEAWVLNDGKSRQQITLRSSPEKAIGVEGDFVRINSTTTEVRAESGKWVKLGLSYDPTNGRIAFYVNDTLLRTESVQDFTFSEVRFLTLFPAGSAETPSITAVYWDDIRIFAGEPFPSYVNIDYTDQTVLNHGIGMSGTPRSATSTLADAEYGAQGKQLIIDNLSGSEWGAGWDVQNASSITGDFVSEISLLIQDGVMVSHGIRGTTPGGSGNQECLLFKFDQGKITAGFSNASTEVGTYASNQWYQVTIVYHSAAANFDFYLNGRLLKTIDTGLAADTAISRMNIWYNGNTDSYLGLRYFRVFSDSTFDTTGYDALLAIQPGQSETTLSVNQHQITTDCGTLGDLRETLIIPGEVALYTIGEDGTYTPADSIGTDTANVLVSVSENGKALEYYMVTQNSASRIIYDAQFEDGRIPDGLNLSSSNTVLDSYETNYRNNTTQALKLTGEGSGYVDRYLDYEGLLVNNFVLEGTVSTTGSFLVSATEGGASAQNLLRISPPYIQYGTENAIIKDLYYTAGEWVRFALDYNKEANSCTLYINGVEQCEIQNVFGNNTGVDRLRLYTAFGTGMGETYLDNLKLTAGTAAEYQPSEDLAVIERNVDVTDVFIYGDKIYTDTPETLQDDVTVRGAIYDLSTVSNGSCIVLKNGGTIKEYTVESIPELPIVNNFYLTVSGDTISATTDIYSFEQARQYTLVLAEYDASGMVLEMIEIETADSPVAELTYDTSKTYRAFLLDSLQNMIPLSTAIGQ